MVQRPPGPPGLPLVGSPWAIARNPLHRLREMSRRYGDVAAMKVGRRRVLFLNHPDLVEQLLVRERTTTCKDPITRSLRDVLGDGLLTSEGKTWQTHRKGIAPSFQPRHLAAYGQAMVDSTLQRMPQPGPIDASEWMGAVTLDIVIRTIFGVEPEGEAAELGPLLLDMMNAFEVEQRTLWRFVPGWVPGSHRRRVEVAVEQLDALVLGLITKARARPPGSTDLLARLIEAGDAGEGFTDTELRDELLTLFLAGHDTTALWLSYALWLLAEHPEMQDRAREEVDALLEGRTATADDVRALRYLEAILKETLRLYPSAYAVGREALEPLTFRGHTIPTGTMVVASQWVMHRDARFWIGPERFRPERWLNGETEALPRMAYFPFGGGARVCVGNHFATMEAVLVLATILQTRRVQTVAGFAPHLVPAVTLRSRNGVQLMVTGPHQTGSLGAHRRSS